MNKVIRTFRLFSKQRWPLRNQYRLFSAAPDAKMPEQKGEVAKPVIDEEVREKILNLIKSLAKVKADKVSEAAKFEEIGLDSLDVVELIVAIEENLNIELSQDDAENRIKNVNDALVVFSRYKLRKDQPESQTVN